MHVGDLVLVYHVVKKRATVKQLECTYVRISFFLQTNIYILQPIENRRDQDINGL